MRSRFVCFLCLLKEALVILLHPKTVIINWEDCERFKVLKEAKTCERARVSEPVGVMKCFECIDASICAYLAGMIDGEGSFTIAKFRDARMRDGTRYEPYLQITNSSEELMKWLVQTFGGSYRRSGKPKAFLKSENRLIVRTKPCWSWLLHAGGLRRILPQIMPYLIVKKHRAELMLEYLRLVPEGKTRPHANVGKYGRNAWIPSPPNPRLLEVVEEVRGTNG